MDRPACPEPGRLFARRAARRAAAGLLGTALLVCLPGCQIVIGVLMMLQGPPRVPADFEQYSKKSLSEKGKKVVVLASSVSSAQRELPSLDIDIATEVTRRLKRQKIDVVDPGKVAAWVDEHGEVTDATADELGRSFGADYIVLVKFDEFGFLEENSTYLYRGHARYKVVVIELSGPGKKTGRTIYNKPFDSKYPIHHSISTDQRQPDVFQHEYLTRLSEEIARLFYEHPPGEDI